MRFPDTENPVSPVLNVIGPLIVESAIAGETANNSAIKFRSFFMLAAIDLLPNRIASMIRHLLQA